VAFFNSVKQWFKSGPKSTLPIIDVAKRFELIGRTGQGSMSKVWRARDKQSGKTMCLKLLDKEKTAKFEARFVGLIKPSEGEVCMVLRHPNIVRTFEHGLTTQGEPYLIMELIDGLGLNFLVETKSPQLEGNRINYLTQLSEGIGFMHRNRFLHRDICPRNIMVNQDGIVKLIDLGLAVPYKPEFCRPGNRTGTTNYLAPELIKRQSTDHRVDMFALGVTAYEIFTGDLPWEKAASQQVLLSHVNSGARDPRLFLPDLDDATAKFLLKAVQRDPADRYQTPADFRDALQALPDHW
jgi:eukaryotic-like serine/threonine-protein kinase